MLNTSDKEFILDAIQFSDEKMKDFVLEEINNLAYITAKGFDRVDQRFEEVDERFDEVDKRFEQVNQRFENIESRLDGINNRIDDLAINRIKNDVFEKLEKRVDKLEKASY